MANKAGEIIARFGGQSALARSLGVNQSTVQHWAKTGQIPSWRREQVLRAAQARGISLGSGEFLASAAPPQAPPAPAASQVAVTHGRVDFIPNVDVQIGQLRDEIGQLRTLLEKLVAEVAALRGAREGEDGDPPHPR